MVANREVMVSVQVTVMPGKALAQFTEHLVHGRHSNAGVPERPNDVWLPSAIDATPFIPGETLDTEFAMDMIIAALDGLAAGVFLIPRMRWAVSTGDEFRTSVSRAGSHALWIRQRQRLDRRRTLAGGDTVDVM